MGPRRSAPDAPPSRRSRARLLAAAPSPADSRRARVTQGRSVLSEATVRREPSDQDMRRKRPPALSFLLRADTARRAARVVSLLALDFAGISLAITPALHETERILAFAYLLTALLFARSGLYAERAQRPGLSRIVGCLFQVTFVALLFAIVNGEHFSRYYLFYGSLAFA